MHYLIARFALLHIRIRFFYHMCLAIPPALGQTDHYALLATMCLPPSKLRSYYLPKRHLVFQAMSGSSQ